MTLTAYPQAFKVLSQDGKTALVETGPITVHTQNGTYGGFGWTKSTWPIEKILTRRERQQVRRARNLKSKNALASYGPYFTLNQAKN